MTVLLGIVGFVVFVLSIAGTIWWNIGTEKDEDGDETAVFKFRWWTVLLVPVGFVFFLFTLMSPVQVGAGEQGVVLNFGATTNQTFDEGLHFKMPFVQTVKKIDVTTQALRLEVAAATKDVQDANLVVTVSYRLDPGRVNQLWQRFRGGHEGRIVIPFTQDAVKSATPLYEAEELIVNRPNVRESAVNALRQVLTDNFMILESVAIENIAFTDQFSQSLEDKAIAKTLIDTARNRQEQARVDAETAKVTAEGQANAEFARADGQARGIERLAQAQAEANDLINASLTDQVIRWRTVDQLADDIRVIVLPSGEEFILGPEVLGR